MLQKEDFKQIASTDAMLRVSKINVPIEAGHIIGKKQVKVVSITKQTKNCANGPKPSAAGSELKGGGGLGLSLVLPF